MTSENPRDFNHRLKELEEQLNLPSDVNSTIGSVNGLIGRLQNWYQTLPNGGKLAVAGVAIVVGFSFLNLFLRLVTAAISLVVLGGLLYLGYKFFIESSASKN